MTKKELKHRALLKGHRLGYFKRRIRANAALIYYSAWCKGCSTVAFTCNNNARTNPILVKECTNKMEVSQEEKIQIVLEVSARITKEVIEQIITNKIPNYWTGKELRMCLADKFTDDNTNNKKSIPRGQIAQYYRDYRSL